MTIITLTTDFGSADGYVGAMKGVILNLAPSVTLVDISHAVTPQDVRHGARILATSALEFPVGTIHVAVVDPGVGSARRGIALRTPTATFVGPDNGLFSPFLEDAVACVALTNTATHRPRMSHTFHGRDVFAPVAAHLANGLHFGELGPPIGDPVALVEVQPLRLPDGRLVVEVMHVDRFGNLVTNLGPVQWEQHELSSTRVAVGEHSVPVARTYSDVAPGNLVALIGSSGYLEIAVRNGSAAQLLGAGAGTHVEVSGL